MSYTLFNIKSIRTSNFYEILETFVDRQADKNGDGRLSFDEIMVIFKVEILSLPNKIIDF